MIVELREIDAVKSTKAASTINAQDSNIALTLQLNFQDIVKKDRFKSKKKNPFNLFYFMFPNLCETKIYIILPTIFNMLSQPKLDI
jgi:hypothetical protein